MLTTARGTWALAVLLAGLGACPAADPLSKEEVAKLGKASTALVVVKPAIGYGSAFCVHASGLFVTNEHVVRGGAIDLVLDPGLKTEKVFAGQVVRADKELDLALVRVEGAKGLAALPLGSDEKLNELAEVIAFGFPFGAGLALDKKEYPAVSVNAGSVTSLRRKDGALHRIQVDAALNPGNSGGPVLDRNGKVIGVVVAGVRGSGVNFVIPVSHLARFVARPDLHATAPALTAANVHQAALFQAKAAFVLPDDKAELELVLKGPDGKERKHKMELVDGAYRASVVPVPAPEGPLVLRVTVVFADGSVAGAVTDLDFKVGAKAVKLSDVRRIRTKPAQVLLVDGKTAAGAVTGLDTLRLRLGGQELALGLADVVEVRPEAPGAAGPVSYTIIATVGGKEVARLADTLRIAEPVRADLPRDDSGTAPIVGVKPGGGEDLPITVAPLKEDKEERALPSSVEAVCHGGGGRFLILHLPKERKLAIFDVNEAKIVKYIPMAEDKIFFAAGMDKLFVLLPGANVIQRWSLKTFEKELTVPSPLKGQPNVMLMGSASQGPLLLYSPTAFKGESVLLDVATLKVLPGDAPGGFTAAPTSRASGDGRLFTTFNPYSSPQGQTWQMLLGKAVRRGDFDRGDLYHGVDGHVTPGPNGRYIFGARGVFTAEGKPVGKLDEQGGKYSIAAAEGGTFYLNLDLINGANKLTLNLVGDARPVGPLDVEIPKVFNLWDREKLPNDLRFFFVPSAKLLAVLPQSNDKLQLYRVDVIQLLEKADRAYLVATSRAPATAARGAAYSYPVVVKSKKGGVKYQLDAGPKGMKVAADGTITWDVPADFDEEETDVILTISDTSGQEIFHSFKVTVVGERRAVTPPEKGADDQPSDGTADKPSGGAGDLGIKVAPLKADREERNLPSPAGDVCAGGGGRLLILHLPRDHKLAVFDVNAAKIVKYLPVTEDDVKFAAGRDKLFVVNPKGETLQRYSLTTFAKETTVPLPGTGKVHCLAMGSASATPLLLGRTSGAIFLDPATLKEVEYEREKGLPALSFRDDAPAQVRVSADGRLVTSWVTGFSPTGLWAGRIDGKTLKGTYKHESPGPLFPGADGSTIFATGQLYAADATPLGKHVGGHDGMVWYVPATQGRYYLALNQKDKGIGLGLHLLGYDRQLVALPGVDGAGDLVDWSTGQTAAFDKHFHFIPDAKLLVVLSKAKDKLVLHRVDVDALVEKSGVDYLFVTSVPPAQFVPGRTLTYTPAVKSKKGGVKLKLELGPAGMTLSPKNELIWQVPVDFAEAETTVLLTVGDATGQEVSHTFRLTKGQPPDK